MDSKDNVFSKGTSKPGRYGSLGNTDMESIKKMLAEDFDDKPVEVAIPEEDATSTKDKSVQEIREASPESSAENGNDKAESLESAVHISESKGEKEESQALQRLNVEVDATLHSQFKAMVGMRKTTMRQVVESFMYSYVTEVKQEFFSSK